MRVAWLSLDDNVKVRKILRDSLALFREGKGWCKNKLSRTDGRGNEKFCSYGAVYRTSPMGPRHLVVQQLNLTLKNSSGWGTDGLVDFNDHRKTKFSDVERLFKSTIRRLEKQFNKVQLD